ncbi:hypothetical protein JGS22_023580 [Streptomyces sp. P38-E01]|uniref:Uncharacterized protein n=1 Tax=Streptomyces tardus TaxID=2780544 RepID=A0A949NB60_9ACTN|nr:hypothetical protein [Streptomyces tardus]MBU7600528.1 hypothetical protein [Streptomyces tardus]
MADRIERLVGRLVPLVDGCVPGSAVEVAVGGSVYDLRAERVGVVQQEECGLVWLRPPGGGREWETRREDLCAVVER